MNYHERAFRPKNEKIHSIPEPKQAAHEKCSDEESEQAINSPKAKR